MSDIPLPPAGIGYQHDPRHYEAIAQQMLAAWHDLYGVQPGKQAEKRMVEDMRTQLEICAIRAARAVAPLAKEALKHRADIAEAAGECLVPVPEPGTVTAKLLQANRLLRGVRDALRRELDSFKGAVNLEFVSALNQIQEERDHYAEYSDRFSKQTLEHVRDALNDIESTLRTSRDKLGVGAFVAVQVTEHEHLLRAAEQSAATPPPAEEGEG